MNAQLARLLDKAKADEAVPLYVRRRVLKEGAVRSMGADPLPGISPDECLCPHDVKPRVEGAGVMASGV